LRTRCRKNRGAGDRKTLEKILLRQEHFTDTIDYFFSLVGQTDLWLILHWKK